MQSIKSFFQMVKFETLRIMRNKLIVSLFVLFPIIFIFILSEVKVDTKIDLVVYTGGKDIKEIQSIDILEDNFSMDNVKIVDSIDKGIDLLKKNKITLFLAVDTTKEPSMIDVYYNGSSFASVQVKNKLDAEKDAYITDAIIEYVVDDYGVKIKEEYFNMVDFKTTTSYNLSTRQTLFTAEVAVALSVILLLGMAYSITKDNETSISKNTAYLPIGKNKYIMSKLLSFVLLGILESLVLFLMAKPCFGITSEIHILLVVLMSVIFITATLSIGLLFSNFKNQISTLFFDIVSILLPVFMVALGFVSGMNILIKILLFALPITPFVFLLNGMIFNGVVIWKYVVYLILQTIVYYLISFFIMKKKNYA